MRKLLLLLPFLFLSACTFEDISAAMDGAMNPDSTPQYVPAYSPIYGPVYIPLSMNETEIMLQHPRSRETVTCRTSVESCARMYEAVGFERLTNMPFQMAASVEMDGGLHASQN